MFIVIIVLLLSCTYATNEIIWSLLAVVIVFFLLFRLPNNAKQHLKPCYGWSRNHGHESSDDMMNIAVWAVFKTEKIKKVIFLNIIIIV